MPARKCNVNGFECEGLLATDTRCEKHATNNGEILFPIEIDLLSRVTKVMSQRQKVGYFAPRVKLIEIMPREIPGKKLYEDALLSFAVRVTLEDGAQKIYEGLAF